MTIDDRDYMIERRSRHNNSFVQLPLPGVVKVSTKRRWWRATVRALRSEWFNTVAFVVIVVGVIIAGKVFA